MILIRSFLALLVPPGSANRSDTIDAVEQNQAILAAIRSSRDILDDELRNVLLDLMENDLNMKIRQAARNTLK